MDKTVPSKFFKKCLNCGRSFRKDPSVSFKYWETAKYCSLKCSSQHRKVWNKGRGVSLQYSAIHKWLGTYGKKNGVCFCCGKKRATTWALMADEYSRNIDDYLELCYTCHNRHDRGLLDARKQIP